LIGTSGGVVVGLTVQLVQAWKKGRYKLFDKKNLKKTVLILHPIFYFQDRIKYSIFQSQSVSIVIYLFKFTTCFVTKFVCYIKTHTPG